MALRNISLTLHHERLHIMEDYLIREIDRIGELLVQIAHRLGLFGGQEHFSEKAL